MLNAEPWSSPTLCSFISRLLSLSLRLRTTKTTPTSRKIKTTPTPTPTPIPVVFALFGACEFPVADVVVTEVVVDTLCEEMEAVVAGSSVLVVCSSVSVVLAPLTAPCHGKTTLCVDNTFIALPGFHSSIWLPLQSPVQCIARPAHRLPRSRTRFGSALCLG